MIKCEVRIGSTQHQGWGTFEGKNKADIVAKVKDQIENLEPINSSPEGREEYRNRFRGKRIYLRPEGEKDFEEWD